MEEVLSELRKIKKEMDEQRNTILSSAEKITENITSNINKIIDEKLGSMDKKYENLQVKVESQDQRLYYLEKQTRQRNLVFFGLEENEKSYANMENNIQNFILKHFGIKMDNRDLQAIRRIGKKTEKPRPVVVTFTTVGTKILILKHKGALKDTQYYIKEDYPQQVLERRRELQTQVKMEREKGNEAIIKYDKLVIIQKKPENTRDNNKRNLSTSPEISGHYQSDLSTHAKKKNKTLSSHTIQRSSSLSDVVRPSMLNFLVSKNSKTTEDGNDNIL